MEHLSTTLTSLGNWPICAEPYCGMSYASIDTYRRLYQVKSSGFRVWKSLDSWDK